MAKFVGIKDDGLAVNEPWPRSPELIELMAEYERGRRDGYEIAKAEALRSGWHLRRYDLAARDHDIAAVKEASQ